MPMYPRTKLYAVRASFPYSTYVANKANQYSTPKVSPRFIKFYVNMYTVYSQKFLFIQNYYFLFQNKIIKRILNMKWNPYDIKTSCKMDFKNFK